MSTRTLTLTALLTAILCLAGPVTLPVGPVPLSLTTAILMLMALLLGERALICCGLYLLLGMLGLPVFSGFTGGLAALSGPTGGFLPGYLLLTGISGFVCQRTDNRILQALGFLGGTLPLYLCGTAWYMHLTGTSVLAAMTVCILPFLPGDALKIIAVLTVGRAVKARLKKAGLLHKIN